MQNRLVSTSALVILALAIVTSALIALLPREERVLGLFA